MYATRDRSAPLVKKSRKSEIALLESISTSLDTYICDNPGATTTTQKTKKRSATDASQNAAKNFLAVKTLVRSMAKACVKENVKVTTEDDEDGKTGFFLDSLVEEYKEKYPSLTKDKLLNGIVRYNGQNNDNALGDSANTEEEDAEGYNIELKFARIISIVNEEMDQYQQKIDAIKKSRELAASAASQPESYAKKPGRKRKSKDSGSGDDEEPKVAKRRGRPRADEKIDDSPETLFMNEVVKRYAVERGKYERLPNGVLENIVEEVKRDLKMEYFEMPLVKLDKKVRFKYNRAVSKGEEATEPSRHKVAIEEVYSRYSRTKIANGGKLPPGSLESIIEGIKLEYGMPEIKMRSVKTRVQARFAKENPQFQSNPPDQLRIGDLGEEDRQRRQLLMNEVTARYARAKLGNKKLPDGTLDNIIEKAKNELGIHEFEVQKASIRGRINRKSIIVQTLGQESPHQAIDEPLVQTINSWLSQGISVTRNQGLELANRLLKGKNLEKDSFGQDMVLDAKWWRHFLERNKRKLVCAGQES